MIGGSYQKAKFIRFLIQPGYHFLMIFFLAFVFWPKHTASSDLHPRIIIQKIGLVSDIHAASQKIRRTDNPGNIIRPNEYLTVFPEVLGKMKEAGVTTVISLGDHTNNSSEKHAKALRKMVEERELEPVWVKGNHDSDGKEDDDQGDRESESNDKADIMQVLGAPGRYYYLDKGDWRIIVLDSSEQSGEIYYQGGISDRQMEWLKSVLRKDKDILIALHHPILDKETKEYVYQIYHGLEEMLAENGHVKYVFSGHWHTTYWEKEHDGIKYYGIPALTLEEREGFYKVIELPSFYYDSYEPV